MSNRLSFPFIPGNLKQPSRECDKVCVNGEENQRFVDFDRMIMVCATKLFDAKKNLFSAPEAQSFTGNGG